MESRHHISIKKYQKLSKPESGFFHNMNRMELQIAIQKYACCQIVVLYKVLFKKKTLCFRHLNNLFNNNFWCFSGEKKCWVSFFQNTNNRTHERFKIRRRHQTNAMTQRGCWHVHSSCDLYTECPVASREIVKKSEGYVFFSGKRNWRGTGFFVLIYSFLEKGLNIRVAKKGHFMRLNFGS